MKKKFIIQQDETYQNFAMDAENQYENNNKSLFLSHSNARSLCLVVKRPERYIPYILYPVDCT